MKKKGLIKIQDFFGARNIYKNSTNNAVVYRVYTIAQLNSIILSF